MKKIFILFFLILSLANVVIGAESYKTDSAIVYESKNHKYYGLKTQDGELVTNARYRKMIMLGDNSWIFQKKNHKFGLMDSSGNILVRPKYSHVERLFDKWVKFGNDRDYGIYDASGNIVIPPKYKLIEPLFGHKFLTYRNHKYGIYSDDGTELLPNKYDFIYMPKPGILRIRDGVNWYEIKEIATIEDKILSEATIKEIGDENFEIAQFVKNTGYGVGYGLVTTTDYALKVVSSMSEAYEDTIDELMLSKGVETISIFKTFIWIPKFPLVYIKKYYDNISTPDNSPLSEIRNDLKKQIK